MSKGISKTFGSSQQPKEKLMSSPVVVRLADVNFYQVHLNNDCYNKLILFFFYVLNYEVLNTSVDFQSVTDFAKLIVGIKGYFLM